MNDSEPEIGPPREPEEEPRGDATSEAGRTARADGAEALERARARIRELEAELSHLEEGLKLTLQSPPGSRGASSTVTISGLEEMVLMVNADRTIGYVNAPMAALLGVADRKGVLGQPLERWDRGPIGRGVLAALAASALSVAHPVVVERAVPGLPADSLPGSPGPRPVGAPVLRFLATPMRGRVQLSVQDVTRLRWLESTFSRFVSPKVIAQMLARPEEDFLRMSRREITMLYVDLRGFTRLSQTLELDTLKGMMGQYFESMQACVERHGGTVGQFVGDEVVALFGAPVALPHHALSGLLAGVDMLAAHRETLARWGEQGWPQPGIGVGISTGEVAVGNMGTPSHMYYTALGYHMNLGARLCSAAGPGELLTVPTTHAQALASLREHSRRGTEAPAVPHLRFSSQGMLRFKNVREPVEVLSVEVVSRGFTKS